MADATVSVVKFKTSVPPYRVGEMAGFPHAIAQRYADIGAADLVDVEVPVADEETIEGTKAGHKPSAALTGENVRRQPAASGAK